MWWRRSQSLLSPPRRWSWWCPRPRLYVVSPDASSDGGAVSATLGRVVGTVDVATVSVATAAGGGAVVAEVGVSGSSTPTELSPLPHAAISRAVDTTAMTEPADRRSSRRVCD